jgi:glycosyltransferase involved in cell wall biosynthesis
MNIALLHYSAPPVVGGVESVLAHHALLMADAGYSVRVIAGRGDSFDPRIDFVALPLIDSRHPDILAAKAELDHGRIPSNFNALVQAIVQGLSPVLAGTAILIAHNVCSLHKNLALTAALKILSERADAPHVILWHHDLAWTTPRYRAELHDGYPWDLLRTAWSGVTQVVVSDLRQHELADLYNIPATQIAVVPNGLDALAFLKLESQTRKLVEQLKFLDAAPLLLMPVRITPRKNIELALRTLGVLRKILPDARLIVTGPPGPHNPANAQYFARLKAIRAELGLESCVHFLAELIEGYLPDEVIADFYRLADALILPSREEGFGIPVIEAGLVGMPVFCADIPPLRALGGDEATYFSPDADPQEVAALIAGRLGADPGYRLRVRVRRAYTWQGVYAERIAPILEGKQ